MTNTGGHPMPRLKGIRMARKKVAAEPVLKSWKHVDEALGEIRAVQGELATDQAALDAEVAQVQEPYKAGMADRQARVLRLEKDVEEYTTAHQAELEASEKRRSKRLPHGTVGFRRSTELATKSGTKWGDVIAALKAGGKRLAGFIRVTEAINKDAVRDAKLPEKKLAALGMRMKPKDTFGYDLNTDETAATVPAEPAARKEAG